MNMEAAAGKNPVTHVGKLYNIAAQQIAESLVQELDEISEAYCYLVSQIGSPINEPQVVDVRLYMHDGVSIDVIKSQVKAILHDKLSNMGQIRQQLVAGEIHVY